MGREGEKKKRKKHNILPPSKLINTNPHSFPKKHLYINQKQLSLDRYKMNEIDRQLKRLE